MIDVSVTINSELFRRAKDEAVARALEAIGQKAEGYAKMLCPVDTGRLRNSITHTYSGNDDFTHNYTDEFKNGQRLAESERTHYSYDVSAGGKVKDAVVYVGSDVEYAPYVEFGTQRKGARPFLKPAATQHSDEYKRIVIQYLKGQ